MREWGPQQTPFAPKSVAKADWRFGAGFCSFHAEHAVPTGVSGAVVRVESYSPLPASADVVRDRNVFNHSRGNRDRVRTVYSRVIDAFQPDECVEHRCMRGRLPVEA